MNFDFYSTYKEYPTVELLKIIQRADQYQEAAINAATQILSERNVSQEERDEVDSFYQALDNSSRQRTEKITAYRNKVDDFLEPVLRPSENIKPDKWLNILLLMIGLQYLWVLYGYIVSLVNFFQKVNHCTEFDFRIYSSRNLSYWDCFWKEFDPASLLGLFSLIYIPVMFYLLWKRKKWGWILLFVDNILPLLANIYMCYTIFINDWFFKPSPMPFITSIIVKSLIAFFIWRTSISDFFGVTKEIKFKTAVFSATISALFLLLMLA
jgi:hypothetical protein